MSTNNTQAVKDAEVEAAIKTFFRSDLRLKSRVAVHGLAMRDALEQFAQSRAQDAAPAGAGGDVGASRGAYGKGPIRPASQWGPTDIQRWPEAYADACGIGATSAAGHPLKEKGHVCGVTCHSGDANCNGYCKGEKDAPAKYFSYATQPQQADGRDAQDAKDARSDSVHLAGGECGRVQALPLDAIERAAEELDRASRYFDKSWMDEGPDGYKTDNLYEVMNWVRAAILSTEKATAGGGGV